MRKSLLGIVFMMSALGTFGQGAISGDLQLNTEFYQRDSLIGATGTPHYDNLLSGANSWLSTFYRNDAWGLEAGVRLDMFLNSNFL